MSEPGERERRLRALQTVREATQTRAEAELAAAQRAEARAREAVDALREQLRLQRARTRLVLSEAKEQSAFALQQAERYREGRAHRDRALLTKLEQAERAELEASEALGQAKHALSQTHAERRAVQQRRGRE